jgi:hypothetical protein
MEKFRVFSIGMTTGSLLPVALCNTAQEAFAVGKKASEAMGRPIEIQDVEKDVLVTLADFGKQHGLS